MFGYVDGGYDAVITRFREVLEERGVRFATGRAVREVREASTGVEVELADGELMGFDKVVLTLSASRVGAVCPQLSASERERLGRVVYQGVVCASLILKRPLSGYYITNITDQWVPFTGVIETTSLVDRDRFGGNALVYLPRYLAQGDPFWERTDDQIRSEFLDALDRMYPDFTPEDVLAFKVSRARDVLAVSTLEYTTHALPAVYTSLPNVFIVNSAQIANGTLNNNETVGLANEKCRELLGRFAADRQPRSEVGVGG
jgi:protoporphyrinogen oxidase